MQISLSDSKCDNDIQTESRWSCGGRDCSTSLRYIHGIKYSLGHKSLTGSQYGLSICAEVDDLKLHLAVKNAYAVAVNWKK